MTFSSLTIAYWCVFIACGLPYLAAWIAKAGSFGPRDNVQPRDWAARQSGWRARANGAQANSFEGLPFFIGAVIIAHQLGAAQARLDMLAAAYVVLRLVYIALYIQGLSAARSAVWALGFIVNCAILFIAP
ncbi:putative MAPEG superfamily protein [Variovorax sp. TBS-050B]|uniref:MAPEG family protein n=1 Tax=Variovorax sp. TBS-050B TaxID=2940551 RepID=UPI0024745F53|nr:MAPEG family protein [Variovorax sp. TBS-050B]MDH6594754.1 putative MAPEG superfamily protein [Variovorax sp. TBS-050B]